MHAQRSRLRLVSDDRLDGCRSRDPNAWLRLEKAHGIANEPPRLGDMMLAGSGKIRRAGKGQYDAFFQMVHDDGRSYRCLGAHRPRGAFFTLLLADGAIGLHQFPNWLCRGWRENYRRAFD